MQLISVFVFTYAKSRVSHDFAHFILLNLITRPYKKELHGHLFTQYEILGEFGTKACGKYCYTVKCFAIFHFY